MSQPKAPCGHPGEVIIGTFVRCLQGCDSARTNPPARRGVPGHVEMCACKPCQIRRRTRTIIIRSKAGEDLCRAAWNGRDDNPYVLFDRAGLPRHFALLDEDGNIIASGVLDQAHAVFAGPGMINIQTVMAGVQLSIDASRPWVFDRITRFAPLQSEVLLVARDIEAALLTRDCSVFHVKVTWCEAKHALDVHVMGCHGVIDISRIEDAIYGVVPIYVRTRIIDDTPQTILKVFASHVRAGDFTGPRLYHFLESRGINPDSWRIEIRQDYVRATVLGLTYGQRLDQEQEWQE